MGTLSQIIPYSADADLSQHFNDDFNSILNALKHSCDGLLLDIYPPDIHNPYPIGIPLILFYQMKKVSKIIERGITAVVENYFTDRRLHESFLRLSEHARWLLKLVESQPYKIGSWRPDILFPDECSDKFVVCEINARFPFNGFYASHAKNSAITELPHLANVPIMPVSELEGIPEAFSGVFDSTKCIGILKSTTPDRGWDVNLFRNSMSGKRKRNKESSNNLQGDLVDIANSDASVPSFLDPPNISRHLSETFQCDGGARFVDPWDLHVGADGKLYDSIGGPIEQFALEISQKELLDMPRDVIRILLTECRYINDIRTILLTHDKRMLSVLTSPEVMKDYMSPSDMQVLQNYIIQTYVCGCQEHSDVILEASRHRSEWILKPNSGGKGVGIVFGRDCSDSKWREMLGDANFAQYVLQRVIKQKVFSIYTGPTQISGDNSSVENGFKDMLLVGLWHCFNDKFLGPGIFRASSLDHPIVNVAGGNGLIFSPVVLSCKWPLKRNIPLVHENGNADRGGVPEPSLMFTPPPHCVFKLRTRNGVNSLLHGAGGERSCEFGSIINALEEDGIALVHTDWLAGYRDSDLQLHSEIIDSQLLELVKKLGGVPNPHTDGGVGGGTSVWNVQPICSNPSKLSGPRPARSLTAEPFGIHTDCSFEDPPPRFMCLFVVREDRCGGGHSILLDADVLVRYLSRRSLRVLTNAIFTLRVPEEFRKVGKDGGEGVQTIRAPILWAGGRWRYRGDIIDKSQCSKEELAAISELDGLLTNHHLILTTDIPQGTVLILDNSRWMHGRTDVKDRKRWLKRIRFHAVLPSPEYKPLISRSSSLQGIE